ncbi:MAG TPA: adenylate/guanylate cyclase domain-containing protein [Desulfuromonadales bacterium]|nr:adenylate/guanylate cyclase domain-containing protein [Desulfuromonadales bacterium]
MKLTAPGETARRYGAFLVIAILTALVGLILYRETFPFVEQVDLRLKDARFTFRGSERPTAPVTVVAIDNKSIKELGRWPWSRELTAGLISSAARQGARVIALDMVFSEPQGERPDRALAAAISSAGNVIMGYFFREETQTDDPLVLEQMAQSRVTSVRIAAGVEAVSLPSHEQMDANISGVAAGAAGFGYFNQISNADGLYRSLPLLMLFRGDMYPSLALAAVNRFRGNQLQVAVEPFGISSVSSGDLSIPANEQGRLSLAYYGPGGTVATVSAADVIAGRLPKGSLQGRLVFIGVTETGIADLRATPLDPVFPGVEIHATFAANALEGRFLTRDSRTLAIEMTAIILLSLLLALVLAAVPNTAWGLAGFSVISFGYLGLNFYLFSAYRLDLSIAYPLMPLVVTYLEGEAYRNLVVERKGRYLKKAFGSYISPELVSEIVKNPGRLQLGGEKREISILFSDIRGFTTLSEGLTPETLVKLLNDYLSPMTRIVMDERGTLDKFIGDAIMAIFNAPLDLPDHPAHACRCALRMLVGLETLNEQLTASGSPRLAIGIGIHTGEAVVGNMGADIRFDYTAIGDSVNLASRLEGLTKFYGIMIIVSEETRAKVGDAFHFRELDLVRVKGKQKPIAIFELLAEESVRALPFADALRLYRGGDFVAALELFELLADSGDHPSVLYADRCREFLMNPPAAAWDGVYTAHSK